MPMSINAYNQNPYAQYSAYKPRNVETAEENEREENRAMEQAEEMAATNASVPDRPVQPQEAKPAVVEGASESDGLRQDFSGSKYSNARMDLMDIQAAFFGFSSRRVTDIQPV